jgi:hypothetical protein
VAPRPQWRHRMTQRPERLPQRLAVTKNAEAMELFQKGKLQEALRALNEAIYSAPNYPHSYANRALVFERLGMFPQAEGDRERARRLALSSGYSEEELTAVSAPAAPAAPKRRPPTRKRPPSSFAQRTRSRFAELRDGRVFDFSAWPRRRASSYHAPAFRRQPEHRLRIFPGRPDRNEHRRAHGGPDTPCRHPLRRLPRRRDTFVPEPACPAGEGITRRPASVALHRLRRQAIRRRLPGAAIRRAWSRTGRDAPKEDQPRQAAALRQSPPFGARQRFDLVNTTSSPPAGSGEIGRERRRRPPLALNHQALTTNHRPPSKRLL